MFRIAVDDAEIRRRLDEVAARHQDLTPLMRDIGDYMVEATRSRFRAGRGPDGAAWAPKRPVTIAAYLRRGDRPDPRPLIGPSRRLSSEIHYRPGRDRVEIGSALVYAAVMQGGADKGQFGATRDGSPIPWGRIPARVYLGIDESDRRNILDIITEFEAAAGP